MFDLDDDQIPSEDQKERLFRTWDLFLASNVDEVNVDVDLIFIPLKLDEHYFCVCINFCMNSLDLLDDRIYDDVEESEAMKLSNYVVCFFSIGVILNLLDLSVILHFVCLFETLGHILFFCDLVMILLYNFYCCLVFKGFSNEGIFG